MPANRHALIRYKTIDACLRNRHRRWTLDDLIEACSDALYEYEGVDRILSRRTIQGDIQMMRSDKLGYNAPIVVKERKYYTYADPDYSIMQLPISQQGLQQLQEAVQVLKQFQGFDQFQQLSGLVQKLEGQVYAQQRQSLPVVDFERNDDLKGLEFLDPLYRAITQKQVVELTYQSFKARQPGSFLFHACLLKEYNNRWFVLGRRHTSSTIYTLALDRIQQLLPRPEERYVPPDFDASSYFQDVIGVTVQSKTRPRRVRIRVNRKNAPYLLTKPLHHSQQVLERNQEGAVVEIKVQHNLELESRLLAYGEGIEVLAPDRLRKRIAQRAKWMAGRYISDENGPAKECGK
ncbi:WYL domain-containing protein [Phaeodactylibacter sp.]|uniref:helix-turn-helix transcriptional regulator n=1 Tax=Phaeodactylibacter sp. TaxID=1940289 RepID=UPI0025F473F3|nr:WYL domain-containing protein [Phaeodactylibacter sp.]MCI4649810.1 WYL domain-containing protein [Phaeodactylibacter sp.]MCI5092226.1 WYL domain-containing protein [Phaeodactylibacter sp.]